MQDEPKITTFDAVREMEQSFFNLEDEKKEEIDSLVKNATKTAAAKATKDFELVKKLQFPEKEEIVWTNRLSESVFSHLKNFGRLD